MKPTNWIIIFLILALLVLGGRLFLQSREQINTPPEPGQAAEATGPPSATNASLAALPLACNGGKCTLPLSVEITKRCGLTGDLDLIKGEIQSANAEQAVLLSVEPVDTADTSFRPITRKISLQQLSQGFQESIALPEWSGPVQLGVFLCRDVGRQNKCAGKQYGDLFNVLAETAFAKKANRSYWPPDRIYFFQYLLWTARESMQVSSIDKSTLPTDAVLEQRVAFIRELFPKNADAGNAMKKAFDISRKLGSVPALGDHGFLHLVLPALDKDPVRCKSPPRRKKAH